MKKLFLLSLILVLCFSIDGCENKNTNEETDSEYSAEEHETYYEQTEEIENTNSTENNINVLANNDYVIDGEDTKIALLEKNEKLEFYVSGHAKTEEKASIMLALFTSTFDEYIKAEALDGYSIMISCGEMNVGYSTTDKGYVIHGKNKDGSIVYSAPDWVVTEFEMTEEEINDYASEILSTLKSFKVEYNN